MARPLVFDTATYVHEQAEFLGCARLGGLIPMAEALSRCVSHLTELTSSDPAVAVTKIALLEQSDEWTLQRCYMQLEGLQTLSDTESACLPAV